jgi:hypothetical protein
LTKFLDIVGSNRAGDFKPVLHVPVGETGFVKKICYVVGYVIQGGVLKIDEDGFLFVLILLSFDEDVQCIKIIMAEEHRFSFLDLSGEISIE